MDEDQIKTTRQLIIQCVCISGVTEESWTEENVKSLDKFILDTSIPSAVVYVLTFQGLQVDFRTPLLSDVVEQLCYMIRTPGAIITEETFDEAIEIHTLTGNPLKRLLQEMTCLHAPAVALSTFKDRHTKDQYTKEMHCFNIFLTEELYKKEGDTILYVPVEALLFSPEKARKDKNLIVRMEMMMIHWTDQIKELLNDTQIVVLREICGPLQEIEFWKSHTTKLSKVNEQLKKREIRHIQKILQHTKSLYVESFCDLSAEIKNCSIEAQSNLKFLSILKEPFEELSQLGPRQIASKLKHIISLIRIIWKNAPYYDSERITGLFCQVNNEIIRLCSQSIPLDKIFEDHLLSSKEVLNDCIYCCLSWKKTYQDLSKVHQKFSEEGWDLDEKKFFLVTDGFIKRLRDLLEVCDCQHQFLHWKGGQQREMEFFRGYRGPELASMLQNIEANFHVALQNLRMFDNCVFDVKDSTWNNEFNSFCTMVDDLEKMMQTLINSAFMTADTVQEGVILLQFFQPMTTRENIRLSVDEKTEEVYDIFKKELKIVNNLLNQKKLSSPDHMSKIAGQAMKAKGLKDHLDESMKFLQWASFMPRSHSYKQMLIPYNQLAHELDEIVRKNLLEWVQNLDTRFKRVEQPLLIRTKDTPSRLDINMDNDLMTLFSDVRFWEQQKYEIPQKVYERLKNWEEIRVLRDHVLLLARNYNRIIEMLPPDELGLFQDQVNFIDRKIQPGLSQLLFLNKGTSNLFINDCLSHVEKLQSLVDSFKVSTLSISDHCQLISETLLVNIDGMSLYRNLEFEDDQKAHQQNHLQKLRSAHQNIISVLTQIHDTFAKDGAEVQKNLMSYIEKVDCLVEEAFQCNIRNSMKKLSIAINGKNRLPPSPLFKVLVILRQSSRQTPSKVEFSPSLSKLAEIVNILPQLINMISEFKRLPELLYGTESQANPIFYNIEQDEKIRKTQAAITAGMSANASNLQAYVKTWDKYRAIWEMNKDNFIQLFKRLNHPVSSFDADIQRYSEKANSVQQEEEMLNIQFVMLDFSPLKSSLVLHCKEWQTKFTDLLCEMAITRLQELCTTIQNGANRLQETHQTLADLDSSLKLQETLMGNLDKTESQISVVHEQFALLDKYEVPLENSVQKMREELNDKWVLLNQVLADSKVNLQKLKETFRNSCLQSHEQFSKTVETTLTEFSSKGPFSSEISTDLALNQIAEQRIQLQTLKQEQDTILDELAFFNIKQPPSKKIQILEKDIDLLQKVWEITKEWNDNWDSWKVIQLPKLQMDSMENATQDMFQKLNTLQQDLKDKEWEIVDFCKVKIQHFKQTIPLITDLRNPAMRDRHWDQIGMELLCFFDHTSADFTLEKILSLGLDHYTDKISEISRAASNELSLEQGLESISKTWKEIFLDIQPYKKDGHFLLRNTEEIHQTFDDNQVTFSTMKTSRFIKTFEQELNQWQRQLSHMLEVVEMILTVQRHWVCLENIFQEKVILPDCEEFAGVSASFKTIMSHLHEENNALQGTQHPGLLENLYQMNTKLEKIRKSLDGYLQTKCQIFPRFYFLSNDDILEALGQPENPQAMQPHMKQCFSNINSLQLEKKGKKKFAVGMFSADGEKVEFNKPVELDSPVEVWLCDVERAMRSTLKIILNNCFLNLKKSTGPRNTWIQHWPGQITIIASQIKWTSDVTQSLEKCKENSDKASLLLLKNRQVLVLHGYSKMIREDLPQVQRLKTAALITVQVHARDVTVKLLKADCFDANDFEWLCQLRLYLEKDMSDVNQCCIQQMNTQFNYGYEYLGNSGRLVITPLTDRCYMTLTTALHLHRGGCLKGPAGTGKTETVKDLGKTLGMFFIVFNCSEGLDYQSMGRIFSGLAQTGAWGCFDEFNRINMEVLSVVGQQTLSILSALSAGQSDFFFEGSKISLVPSCGIFVTMNPGYAGHTELPDSLKIQFRPVSMVVPDSALIAKVLLFAAGFKNYKLLAKKVFTLYSLAAQLLSKQDHYDFGLCNLTSMLRYAGNKRHSYSSFLEEDVLVMAMKDMTVPKLTSSDLTLFNGLIQDIFRPVKPPIMDYSTLKEAIEFELQQRGLQVTPFTVTKVIQLYETKNSQHSSMLVGETGSGKSVTWKTLQNALTALQQKGEPGFQLVQMFPLSPTSLSLGELYGEKDLSSNEWTDGVLTSLMRSVCTDEKPDEKWIVFDGPVDTLWIESLNSVMDDNKVLTLQNGERILVPEQVSFLFEVENLAMASPATVSHCGVVYNNYADLGWRPFVHSWLEKRHKVEVEHLKILFDKYVESTLNFKRINCREPIPTTELNGVTSLCHLYESLATPTSELHTSETKTSGKVVELWFVFSLIWSICASVDEDGRRKINNFLREINHTFPLEGTIYEYYVNPKSETWDSFEEQLPYAWRYNPTTPFYEIMVPTLDTVQYNLLIKALVLNQYPVLLTGPVGAGKTVVAQSILQGLDNKWASLTINMSSQITCNNIQSIIKSRTEQKNKVVLVPADGKQMLCFLDDLNMPAHDPFGSQPPLEMLRFWIDYGFWYTRQKRNQQFVKDVFLMASMGPPGRGRTQISARLQSRFSLINMTFPEESRIKSIYGSIINQKLQLFKEEVKPVGDTVTQATLELFNAVAATFLPTPAKAHYLFSLRDISKVFQGLLRARPDIQETQDDFARLWLHECYRVFSDRLINQDDMNIFADLVKNKLASHFSSSFNRIWPNKQSLIFGDFLNNFSGYEDVQDINVLKEFFKARLEDHNSTAGIVPMNLVFFQDAIKHITRVIRVIRQPRGHMLLIGIEGSGRHSLSKMAAFICGYQVFQVEVTKQYHRQEFRKDIKNLYHLTGVENKPTVLLLNDSQIVDESFLEDINNILSSGEVPNLYKKDEFTGVCKALSELARKDDMTETPMSLFSYLIERVRNNLHIVLCMSPVGEPFRKCILQYPAIMNCTTMDWFQEWPKDALLEVAGKYLDGLELGSLDKIHRKLASFFETTHQSVKLVSQRMKVEIKGNNYVTPANYLELVSGYRRLLVEKRSELSKQVSKLKNCLFKISDTQEEVEAMSVELKEVEKQMVEFQDEYDQFFVAFLQHKKDTSRQQKMVGDYSEKIQEEELQCKEIADNAQKELDLAMPALFEALKALESLNKKDLIEIRTYTHPPALVEMVLQAVMILLDKEPSWEEAKKHLGEANFIKSLINFDKNNISDRVLKKVDRYCIRTDFLPETIGKVSLAAKSLCMWVKAMEVYGRIYRAVEPKMAQLNVAQSHLAQKQAALAEGQNKLRELSEEQSLKQKELDDKVALKDRLRKKSEEKEVKLGLADRLMSELAEERVRWTERVASLEETMECLVGDCLLAASFLSYMGPFLSNYRDELRLIWKQQVVDLKIPFTQGFSFIDFLSKPTVLRYWNIQGLPSDGFSAENSVIITHGNRWPLIVDPQGQAFRWIQNMENEKGLKLIDYQMPDYLQVLEDAIQFGSPVLLHNVQQDLDLSLNPVLNKSLTQIGGRLLLKLGDREVGYNPEFRLYITTEMSSPHYTPEIFSKATIVNFPVNEQGLEAQLLGVVARSEQPHLEQRRDSLMFSISAGTKELQELEDRILSLLNKTSGSLLDDMDLINILHTAREVTKQLESSKQTTLKIDSAREAYRQCAQRASILFSVMNSMSLIDPMYQFSLDAYISLFTLSVERSRHKPTLEERMSDLNDYHTYAMYSYTCRTLFEAHKLVFSFQMCTKILEVAGKLDMNEYSFFLRGGNINKHHQRHNPCASWLPDSCWDKIVELETLLKFKDIQASLQQNPQDWKSWLTNSEPEKAPLPGDWDITCNDLQKMLIVRSLRQDRVSFCITAFIVKHLGPRFVEPPVLNMTAVVKESTSCTPLIFVLSPGVDPMRQLVEASGTSKKLHTFNLGQGQAPITKSHIEDGVKNGHWLFLANCHLSLSWMPELDRLIKQLQKHKPHPNFRLWLSLSPHPEFPITILQAGIKMAIEPPKGVKANMKHLYQLVNEPQFNRCTKPALYKKLLLSLCFFHSILVERKKFQQMGWNVLYNFNNSDFQVTENLLCLDLDTYKKTPWDLIVEVIYSGHVTDEWDQRLLTTYIKEYFCEAAINPPSFNLSTLPTYNEPLNSPLSVYKNYIDTLPPTEQPEVFGLHPNADILSQTAKTRTLLDTLLSLQPQITSWAEPSREDTVLKLLGNIRHEIPALIDSSKVRTFVQEDPSPLNMVLLQEILSYNSLLETISSSLVELEKGMEGLVVMSPSMEETLNCIYDARVPPLWEKAYPSLKPLAAWTQDLRQRVSQFSHWAETTKPPVLFWLSGFISPSSFLTAVLQSTARQNEIPIDILSWEFIVSTKDDISIIAPPKDGVYIRGLYLEGAGWDNSNSCLVEADPMQMFCPIPAINFKPVESHKKKKKSRSVYLCPCYYYPVRAGRESFLVGVELKPGDASPEHWIKRGTALLMSLDN